eukprot:58798-Pleurochrysis_carterae.AAC.3
MSLGQHFDLDKCEQAQPAQKSWAQQQDKRGVEEDRNKMRPKVENRSTEALSGSFGNAKAQEEADEEHEGAGGACARGSVATAYERRPGRLLNTSSSALL